MTTLSLGAMVVTPLSTAEAPEEKLLSSILNPVMSIASSPTFVISNQSSVPPEPLELITSVMRRIGAA